MTVKLNSVVPEATGRPLLRLPHPNVPTPDTLPGFLDPATLRWVAARVEEEVAFWRGKMIAKPKADWIAARHKEARNKLFWWENVAARSEQQRAADAEGSELAG